MPEITKDEFLNNYMPRIRSVLDQKLPDKAHEYDMIRLANWIIEEDITKITRWIRR